MKVTKEKIIKELPQILFLNIVKENREKVVEGARAMVLEWGESGFNMKYLVKIIH